MKPQANGVYYIAEQEYGKYPMKILAWLGFRSPQRLDTTQREYTNDVILYILRNVHRHEDAIEHVRKTLHGYPHATGARIIYILAIIIYDDAKKHKDDCFIPRKTILDTFTLLEFHCTCKGHIHNCRGNTNNKEYIQKQCFKETQATRCSTKKPHGKKAKYLLIFAVFLMILFFIPCLFFRWKCELHQLISLAYR